MLAESLSHVRQRIEQACQRCGRDPQAVQLVCVTKTVPVDVIQQTISLGVTDVGENRVQEAQAKQQALGIRDQGPGIREATPTPHPQPLTPEVRWHLVGHLQRNKAKDAVELFDVIHSVDSVAVAEELEQQFVKRGRGARDQGRGKSQRLEVFVQVNVSGEKTKFGCTREEAFSVASVIARLPHLKLIGLMTMAPFAEDSEKVRSVFRELRLLRDSLQQTLGSSPLTPHPSSLLLSMGMSNDFEVAIEEGSDVVRIGTAIFRDEGPGIRGGG